MSFIRRILSHSFLLFLLAGVALAWYFRADIFSGGADKNDQAAVQQEDEGIVTVESSDDLAAENNQPAKTAESGASQGQTVFGGNPQASQESGQDSQADMSKYRPLTPEVEADADNAQPVETASTDKKEPEENTQVAQQLQPDTEGSTDSAAAYRPLTPEVEAVTENAASTDAATTEVKAADSDTNVAQLQSGIEDTGVAAVPPVQQEPVNQAAQADASQVAPAQDANIENKQAPELPLQAAQTNRAAGDQYGSSALPIPAIPEPESLSQQEMKLISSARQAFWQQDTEKAEKEYKALIELQADSPDPYGELGNVYYTAGKWSEASEMYYEAGVRLIDRKQYGKAMHMVSVLRGLDTERASELKKNLDVALPAPGEVGIPPGQ